MSTVSLAETSICCTGQIQVLLAPALLNWLENLIKTRKKIHTVSVTPPQAVSEMLAWPGLGPHVAGGSLVLVQWSVSRQLTRTLVC